MIDFIRRKRSRSEWIRLSDTLCGIMWKSIIALLLLLLLSQLALQNDTFRSLMTSADRWEGTRLN